MDSLTIGNTVEVLIPGQLNTTVIGINSSITTQMPSLNFSCLIGVDGKHIFFVTGGMSQNGLSLFL